MATVVEEPERAAQKVILHNISWTAYERPVFAALGIPEVWRYDGKLVSVHTLDRETGAYCGTTESKTLAGVMGEALSRLVEAGLTEKRNEWLRRVRAWVYRK
jgi:hypothetical protein